MIKEDYIEELSFDGSLEKGKKGNKTAYVSKVQEWLNLNTFLSKDFKCVCMVDGDFGPQTEKAVKIFQKWVNSRCHPVELPINGIVDRRVWDCLTVPMKSAFRCFYSDRLSKREHIIAYADRHLKFSPRELENKNKGPWVRAYMGGHDGKKWPWCVGSVLTILDLALSKFNMNFTDILPNTYSCDVLGNHAKKTKQLIRNKQLKEMSLMDRYKTIQPGDLILISKTPSDWTHTGLILEVHDDHFTTWEGNTNDEGSREGFEVCKRNRYFRKSNIDVVLLNL